IQQGESNLMIIPPMNESFELKEELSGNTFTLLLSHGYLLDLSCRFPHLLEPVLDKLKKKDFCHLRKQNLQVSPRMRGAIQRIQSYDAGQIAGSLFLEAQILDLLGLFFSQPEQPASSNGHAFSRLDQERIHRAKDILLERMETPPTLAELSRLVGSNEFKLKRGFKELFGTSPYAYLLQQKLELARSYILDTELTIGEIAYQVGYSDPAHLTHAFRKQYGIRPSDLR
ncbi:MAG: AraC family transcriptional regulator, partial [Balneolales bacterium]